MFQKARYAAPCVTPASLFRVRLQLETGGTYMSADGNWKTTINSPMGVQEGTLTINTSGDTFTGTLEGRQGAQDISGKVDGNTLTWSAAITQPFPITLEF